MTARKPDWDQRLNDYLAKLQGKAHAWGKHDCVTFADGWHKAATGHSFLEPYRGKWKNEASAKAIIVQAAKDAGAKGKTLPALVDALLPRIETSMAQRGDIILTADGNLAICYGHVALAVGDPLTPGLIRIEREEWKRAWAVGDRP